MVEKSNTTSSDMYYVNDNALDGYTVSALPVNLVEESRVASNVFQAYILVAASIDVTFVGRYDISSGYFGASYHLTGTDVNVYDNNVNNFNYVDHTVNSVKANFASGINMIYFPQDSSFSQFKKPNISSAGNYIAMSHRMNVYGRSLPSGTLSQKSVMVNVTKVYATLPVSGFEDVLSAHTNVNEVSEVDMNKAHGFIKDTGLGVRVGGDNETLVKFLNMHKYEQESILDGFGENSSEMEKRDELISRIKNFSNNRVVVELPKYN